jgi:hypothetical protein
MQETMDVVEFAPASGNGGNLLKMIKKLRGGEAR